MSASTFPQLRKVAATNANAETWKANIGRAVQRARSLVGWSLKEFSAAVGRDERQIARWISGAERPQFDTLFAVEQLRQPLIIALSELAGAGVQVETVVRITHTSLSKSQSATAWHRS